MPACTRSSKSRISSCARSFHPNRCVVASTTNLPADINILAIDRVPARFHARHAAVARSYLYQIARRRSAFAKPFVWWVKEPLDLARMREAAARFAGMHDFQSFSDADPDEQSTDVLVDEVALAEAGDLILIRVTGSHFIWKMVRRMVGVLAEVGRWWHDGGRRRTDAALGRSDAGSPDRTGFRPVPREGVLRKHAGSATAAGVGVTPNFTAFLNQRFDRLESPAQPVRDRPASSVSSGW